MEKIKSFRIDHLQLDCGIYISRETANTITFDCRFRKPYLDVPMEPAAMHTIEHLLATVSRNSNIADKVVYVGPMGCCTGFYVVMEKPVVLECFIAHFVGWCAQALEFEEVPGTLKEECGNCEFHDLKKAKIYLSMFITQVLSKVPSMYKYINE